jgi:FSR family fosmidomycin resistance protein-like MFS transporter
MAVGLPAAVSTTVVVFLVPTHLNELGFDLPFGGLSAAMFGWGGVVGPFVWAAIARRKGDIACSAIAFTLSFPFMVLYLVFVESPLAVWMLFGVGFFSMSAYILTITLARHSRGLNLGHRMAFIVGGTWGVAAVVFMALAPVAERYGTGLVLKLTPAGYLASGFIALCVMREYRKLGRPDPRASIAETAAEEHTPL